MKKILTAVIVLALCLMIAVPVAAANDTATKSPSFVGIGIGGIEIDYGVIPGALTEEQVKELSSCVVITTMEQAEKKSTDITQEERDLLLQTYADLESGAASMPEGYVVRELVDISFKYNACRAVESHGHKDQVLKEEDVTLTMSLNLGVADDAKVLVMTLIDGVWSEIESVENKGNGIVTCVFEDLCPVAFAVAE